MRIPYRPIPRPQAMAMPARSASCRLNGPPIPAGSDGSRSQPTSATAPRSRRSKARTPIDQQDQVDDGEECHRRPVRHARHRPVAGGPVEIRQRGQRIDHGRQAGVAVDQVAAEQDDEPEREARGSGRRTARSRTRGLPGPPSSRRTARPGRGRPTSGSRRPAAMPKKAPTAQITTARISHRQGDRGDDARRPSRARSSDGSGAWRPAGPGSPWRPRRPGSPTAR